MACVVFVRAANVGGHNTFSTAKLAVGMKALDVRNVGAAGTFVVRSMASATKVRAEFRAALPRGAGFNVVAASALKSLVESDPFSKVPDTAKPYLSVLMARPKKSPALPLEHPQGAWAIRILSRKGDLVLCLQDREVQPRIYPNERIERTFGVGATTRGWPTIERVVDLLGA